MVDAESEALPQDALRKQRDPGEPPKVPIVGRSWHKRGVGYWSKRIGFVLGMVLIVIFGGIGGFGLYTGFKEAVLPYSAWPAADAVVAIASCATLVVGVVHARIKLRQQRQAPTPTAELRERSARTRAQTSKWQGIGQALVYVCAPLVLPLMGYFTGMVAGGLLGREIAAEIAARHEWEARCRLFGVPEEKK